MAQVEQGDGNISQSELSVMFKKTVVDYSSFVVFCVILLEVTSNYGYTVVIKG